MAHRPVDPQASFPDIELEVLERWRQRNVFAESLRRREGASSWGFYEGPPTANGAPGAHHVLARVFKDIFPRYKTMCGHYVERKGGWDCHGLYVKLPSTRGTILVWTTTPWTLVSNAAVAVDPELTYVKTDDGFILAEAAVHRVLGEAAKVVERFNGSELVGLHYEPPFDFIAGT